MKPGAASSEFQFGLIPAALAPVLAAISGQSDNVKCAALLALGIAAAGYSIGRGLTKRTTPCSAPSPPATTSPGSVA